MLRTRFAPSPTGFIHCGNARTALFSALYAKKYNGHLVLRIEDTDHARSKADYTDQLQDDLKWFGVEWQEGPDINGPNGPYRQSSRHDIYVKYYQMLEEQKLIYPCFCTDTELALYRKLQISRGEAPRYAGTCLKLSADEIAEKIAKGDKPAWRFQVPKNQQIQFEDLVKGPQNFSSNDLGDFIIRRTDGSASFFFCNAIDDAVMQITHVLRGEDHLTNTPRQLLIMQALNLTPPSYGHLPLIVGEDGAPLSKRHGSFSLKDLRGQGYLPLALLNYMGRLGHVYENNQLMTFAELASSFNPEKFGRAPAHFDLHQLNHWQKLAVLKMNLDEMQNWLGEDIFLTENNQDNKNINNKNTKLFLSIMQHNILFPKDAKEWIKVFWQDKVDFSAEQIIDLKSTEINFYTELSKKIVEKKGDLKSACSETGKQFNLSGRKLFHPVRLALTGRDDGPELAHVAELMGVEQMVQRLEQVVGLCEK